MDRHEVNGASARAPVSAPVSAPAIGRRRFMALGGLAAASVASVMAASALPGCARVDEAGLVSLFGARTAAVRAVGIIALDGGPLAGAGPDEVAAMLPADGIGTSVDGTRLVVEVLEPVTFGAAVVERSAAELAAGSLQLVAGYLLTPTEMALAAAVAMSTA